MTSPGPGADGTVTYYIYWYGEDLADLVGRETERPLYVRQDRETGVWERVDALEGG